MGCAKSTLSKNHTAALCKNIKAAGIKIFTIGFGTSSSADKMLKACASPDEGTLTYAYEPDSASELKDTVADMLLYPVSVYGEWGRRHWRSFGDVMENARAADLAGRIVLVGRLRTDKFVERWGFARENRFGVEYHAEALNTLLHSVELRSLGIGGQLMVMGAMALMGAGVRQRAFAFSWWWRGLALLAVLSGYLLFVFTLVTGYKVMLNMLYHVGAFGVAYWMTGKIQERLWN